MQFAVPRRGVPGAASLRRWALAACAAPVDITVRVVGSAEGRRLNRRFRGRSAPTNVLSFPYGARQGDVVLCHPVVAREARAQRKAIGAHYAHLVVHGMLHLLGHDHQQERQARSMEAAERRILRRLGFADPYAVESPGRHALRR